ncbi:RAS guanyl-releasing protein 4-like [Conger conger]|uniref:RAS guanyl-releasing protein 4-like n=1 Tax=Conger conger TaxID=82655 RepID=UPI002A5A74B1|nr:RAS guanyl-releasing protein 4-like [Conger conger]
MPAQEERRRRTGEWSLTMNRKETKRKSRHDSPGGGRCRRPVQRRMTCPSPQEISQALLAPAPNGLVRAASLDDLIQRCLHSFDSEGKLSRGTQLVHMTLMMHSWVVPSHAFAQKLLSLYKDCPVDRRGQQRAQICHLIRHWVNQFPGLFEKDPLLERVMGDLWALVKTEGGETQCQMTDTSDLNLPVNPSQAPSPSVKKRKVSLLFDHMEPGEMAQHLSYLEFKNFCSVSYMDYRSYVERGTVRGNPALERSVMLCNGISQWVQLMILNRHTAQQRAQVFTKFIHVAQKLQALQNFNTLMAVIGGLCHSSISRLKDTASFLPPDVTKTLSEMTDLLSSSSNYGNYRRVYSECVGFKVPILGVHLKDLISLNEALPAYIEDDKINLSKLQHLYSNMSDLLAIHSCDPPFQANKDLLHLLTLSLDLCYTEDEIYELSYAKEPKNPKIQTITRVKPPVVAEWGSEVTPRLDPSTISRHVKQLVESIMKNYDLNFDGYIALEDFENLAASFPFSFCPHESDREGEISQDEITSYFMRGMSICAKLGFNFLHNFHETTYKKPTFCDTCGGLLWGVIKRGYHCKDCGVNCHKHCKNQVGPECIKRFKIPGSSCPCTPTPSRGKGHSWSSEEDSFVFPPGEDPSSAGETNGDSSELSDQSTQTDPGVWTPGSEDRTAITSSHTESSLEKSTEAPCSGPHTHKQGPQQESPAPQRTRGTSMPMLYLEETMENMHLHKSKSQEAD